MTSLSKHFTLAEFTRSSTAERLKINNNPTVMHLDNLKRLAEALETIRSAVGKPINISSGYRSAKLNAAVPNSSKTSAHVKGLAADINVKGMSAYDLAKFIEALDLPLDQLIYEYPNRPNPWVHIGLSEGKPRGMVFTVRDGVPNQPGIVK